jgi:hypothetical protein
MGARHIVAALFACILLVPTSALAQKRLGAGPYFNTKYRLVSAGIASKTTSDGNATVSMDSIETINCSGCDVVSYYPGIVFNVRNNTKKPLCFALNFKPKEGDFGSVTYWGAGQIFLLRPRQTVEKFAGITTDFGANRVNLGYEDGMIHAWQPIDKKNCGAIPE